MVQEQDLLDKVENMLSSLKNYSSKKISFTKKENNNSGNNKNNNSNSSIGKLAKINISAERGTKTKNSLLFHPLK